MEPAAAAAVLQRTLRPRVPVTVADASVASGLPLRDAESGLTWLTHEYRGHLRVTEDGDLVHVFPHGFAKPWEKRERIAEVAARALAMLVAVGRFVVRAWLLIVMIAYALVFVALLIALTFTGSSRDRDDSRGMGLLGALFRAIADAMFWTFHPFSPLAIEAGTFERRRKRDETPFYEKVNRFVFGPAMPPPDPHAARALVLSEIRAKRGRITLADVMRVTGLPRDQADPLMARLMLDHDGSVDVGEAGGIVYTFEAMRMTAGTASTTRVAAAWETPPAVPPLTGNATGSNVGIALLNAFNLLASGWVIEHGLTIRNIALLLSPRHPPLLADGVPIVLGLVPFAFSLLVFVLPVLRALGRSRTAKRIARERARLAVLKEVVTRAPRKEPVSDEVLRSAVRVATGSEPTSKELTARVVELGGDVDVGPAGEVRYRFAELEADEESAAAARAEAGDAKLGAIVYATDRD
jgi:hypothetical protein